jgi:hypothetical protein
MEIEKFEERHLTPNQEKYMLLADKCRVWEKTAWFNSAITITILIVGVMIGVDTDRAMTCERFVMLGHGRPSESPKCGVSVESFTVSLFAQILFTVEVAVKVCARGMQPMKYFDDGWNKLDFMIVTVGFIEMSPLGFLFEAFPVVLLRMLRLLRVFRLAKTLPRLRAIVEALIAGFSAVGWICILMVVVNYITGAVCMILFGANDPFHFGSVGKAAFTIMRLSTGDAWDQVLLINLYGCDHFPLGYPILDPATYVIQPASTFNAFRAHEVSSSVVVTILTT